MSGNPMRWDCKRDGCFNAKRRPKTEVFSECFGRGINFGDVDGIVERLGHFLLMEWKGEGGTLGVGQKRLHDALLALPSFTVVVVSGNAETMVVSNFVVRHRRATEKHSAGLDELKARIRAWYGWADKER